MMDIPPCPDALENQFKKEWKDADPELQGEFLEDFELYRAYCWARERGAIKYKLGYDGDLEKINKIQQRYYSDTKSVKTLAKVVNAKTVKTQTRNAGKASAARKAEQNEIIHDMWMQIAEPLRRHNPDISIPKIAQRICEHMEGEEDWHESKLRRSKGTIENYLRDNL